MMLERERFLLQQSASAGSTTVVSEESAANDSALRGIGASPKQWSEADGDQRPSTLGVAVLSQQAIEALPVAIYVTDAAGGITFYNEAAATLWGHRPQLGTQRFCGSWRLRHPDGSPLPHAECPMALALKERRP